MFRMLIFYNNNNNRICNYIGIMYIMKSVQTLLNLLDLNSIYYCVSLK